jgi:hypothetical protein
MIKLVRWLSVPIAAIAVWYVVLLIGIALVGVLDSLCPPDLVVSGLCTAPWYGPVFEALLLICTAAVAAALVIVPALVAPAHQFGVAVIAYSCGAVVAVYVAFGAFAWGPFVASALSGSAALWLAAAKWRAPRMAA